MSETQDSANIHISRDAERDIKMRGLEVLLDDEFVENLKFGMEVTRTVVPGDHVVKITNKLYSAKLAISTKPGETIHIQVGNYFGKIGMMMVTIFGFGYYKVFINNLSTNRT